MQSFSQHSPCPRWAELLRRAVSEPGIVSQAYTRFHRYSLGNQLLAMVQCIERGIQPGPIATFPRWKELGRYVRKGERALTLCMPVTVKRNNQTEANDEPTEQETCFTRFVYKNHWFVLAQTDGTEYQPDAVPGWEESKALCSLAVERVDFTLLDGNCQGYAIGRSVAVSPLADMPHRTLLHELAHVVLGHTAEGRLNDGAEITPRDIRELEAECVALLCCESLGLPGADFSRGYIQSWYRGQEVPERSAQRIFHAADLIVKSGSADHE